MEILLTLFGIAFLVSICYQSCKKRTEITHHCPKCGTLCNASPWSTGIRRAGGNYIHNFKCPNCGKEFQD